MVHIHAEGPAFFCWIPKLFGKRVISTIHGLDWNREKWHGSVASKFIRGGEKNAVKYADEIIVLSKGVQKYFMETYGRETHFIPNGVNRPEIREMMVFATNLIISFFFTPIVLNKLGNEAYGFVGLVNNFVSYISVITVALNSLAGRFITLSYHRHDEKKVREYFSSVFFADTILGVLVLGAAVILCVRIEYLINIPEYLVSDVRTTVILAFFSSTISLIGVVFEDYGIDIPLWEKIMDQQGSVCCAWEKTAFEEGMKVGIRLMMEAMK